VLHRGGGVTQLLMGSCDLIFVSLRIGNYSQRSIVPTEHGKSSKVARWILSGHKLGRNCIGNGCCVLLECEYCPVCQIRSKRKRLKLRCAARCGRYQHHGQTLDTGGMQMGSASDQHVEPRRVQAARYGRTMSEPGCTCMVSDGNNRISDRIVE